MSKDYVQMPTFEHDMDLIHQNSLLQGSQGPHPFYHPWAVEPYVHPPLLTPPVAVGQGSGGGY